MRGTKRISTPAIKATSGCRWARLRVMASLRISGWSGLRCRFGRSAKPAELFERQKNDGTERDRQEQPAERGARAGEYRDFLVGDLLLPSALGAVEHQAGFFGAGGRRFALHRSP